jgi:hypothetical protein
VQAPSEQRESGDLAPLPDAADRMERRGRIILWTAMIAGLIAAGTAFSYKVAEFIFTLGSKDVQGFADVPVTVYFAVAAGWLCLLGYCFASGKFKDIESSKWDMLKQEMEYERRGE